ncbi:restriction endonuclease subunit S [Mannheimia bovis]|uniref:restriction endonuclease subunit S n=1 Tax=Mannheimia bovis TaxID=2770636 RepID=UPI0024B6ECE7|nr:restriction endonuclease subunit S [Mannheimia bovis]WHP47889.1 restriction endonuclease subunit S [Mannheimia bovis]
MKRYEKYKPSGVEWLGEVPEEWDIKRTKFNFEFSKGLTITKENLIDEGIPCVNYGEIHSKFGFEVNPEIHDLKFVSDDYLKYPATLLKKGDFIFADTSEDVKGSGNFTYLNSDIPTFAGYHTIIARLRKNHNPRFLAYVFDSDAFRNQIRTQIKGVKVFSITQAILKNTFIWLPQIEEQIAIVNYLDKKTEKIDRLISHQQALLEKLSEKRTALITETVCGRVRLPTALNDNEALGGSNYPLRDSGIEWLGEVPEHWLITRLKYVGEIVLGLTYSPEDITNDENAILVLRSSNVQNGKLLLNDNVYVNKDIPKKMQTTENDILICSRNGSRALIGKCAVIEGDAIGQTFGAFMTVFRSPYKRFIYYVLSSELFKSQLGNYLTSTINQLTTQVLGNFEIAFPPESEQTAIVNYLDTETAKIDRLQHKIERVIERLKEYRSALITQVVTGKVKV